MNKIANWVFGSFFRTIGRLLVFVLLGFIIAHFVDFGSLIENFRITDLFFEKVNASTWGLGYADNVQYKLLGGGDYQSATYGNGYWTFNGALTESDKNRSYYFKFNQVSIPNNAKTIYANIRLTDLVFSGTSNSSVSNITFDSNSLSCTINHEYDSGQNDIYNIESSPDAFYDWTQIQYNGFNCTLPSLTSETYNVKYGVQLYYTSNGSDNDYYPCYANSSAGDIYSFICPVMSNNISGYRINLVGDTSFQIKIGMANLFNYDTDTTQAIIDNQNQNTQQQMQQQQQQHNEMMNDTVQDSNETESAFEDFESFLPENGIITQLITLPITLYTNILNSVNASCSAFSLGNIFGKHLTLPCINISSYLGSNLWGVIDILMSGFFVLVIARKLIKVFNSMSSMKEGDVLGD